MPSRAAKAEKRRRQSQRDTAAHQAGLAADATLRRVRADQAARRALEDRWGLGEIVPIRGGRRQAVVQVAGTAFRLGGIPWFDSSLAGREPLDVALRQTPPDWDPAEPLVAYVVFATEWDQHATVTGIDSAVDTLADWLGYRGDRKLLPAVLALGGFPAAAKLVSE